MLNNLCRTLKIIGPISQLIVQYDSRVICNRHGRAYRAYCVSKEAINSVSTL